MGEVTYCCQRLAHGMHIEISPTNKFTIPQHLWAADHHENTTDRSAGGSALLIRDSHGASPMHVRDAGSARWRTWTQRATCALLGVAAQLRTRAPCSSSSPTSTPPRPSSRNTTAWCCARRRPPRSTAGCCASSAAPRDLAPTWRRRRGLPWRQHLLAGPRRDPPPLWVAWGHLSKDTSRWRSLMPGTRSRTRAGIMSCSSFEVM